MSITIKLPYGFSEPGRRADNQDAIAPMSPDGTSRQLYLVCDGVGGAPGGAAAARLAADRLTDFYRKTPVGPLTADSWETAITQLQNRLEQHAAAHPQHRKMATTVAFLTLEAETATVGHVGDSRVYQFRAGRIVFRTEDHSYTNELIAAGQLTAPEAMDHPQRHVITRAVGPTSRGGVKPTIRQLTDIRAGDYFLLCTDGVNEALTDTELANLFGAAESPDSIVEALRENCGRLSSDNYSAWLLPIRSTENTPGDNDSSLPVERSSGRLVFWILLLCLVLFVYWKYA